MDHSPHDMTTDTPGFIDDVREIFTSGDPLVALTTASAIASFTEATPDPFSNSDSEPSITEVAEMLFQEDTPQTDWLLVVWEQMLPQSPLTELRHKQLLRRLQEPPQWLRQIDQVRPVSAASFGSYTGEFELVAIEFACPWGPLTLVVGIAYSGIALIEDGYAFPGSIKEIIHHAGLQDDPAGAITEISLADAKAIVDEAADWHGRYIDAPETDTWPACKPLLLWGLRTMPDGGRGHVYREYTEEEIDAEVDAFISSPYAAGLGRDAPDQAHLILSLATNYGTGDIRQWSAQLAERMLLDLVPRKVIAGQDYLRPIPKVLEAIVRYYHAQLQVPPIITEDVVATIAGCKRTYSRLIKPSYYDSDFSWLTDSWELDIGEASTLDSLTTDPLPKEKVKTRGMSMAVAHKVRSVAEVIEAVAPTFFGDTEMTTSALRILAKLGRVSPEYFLSKSTTEASSSADVTWQSSVAGAVCWVCGKANNWFKQSDPERTVKALMSAFGLKNSPTTRGTTIVDRLPGAVWDGSLVHIGDASLLTSRKRMEVLAKAADSHE